MKKKLKNVKGNVTAKIVLIPAYSATKPNEGGASKNITNDICASAATFSAAGLSVS